MEKIIEQTITKAIKMLEACGCKFAVIDPDGNQHGDLEVVVNKKRGPNKYPHGELRNYIKGHLSQLSVGEVLVIPVGRFDFASLQSSISSAACAMFGNESCTTSRNRENNTIEVLRVM